MHRVTVLVGSEAGFQPGQLDFKACTLPPEPVWSPSSVFALGGFFLTLRGPDQIPLL